MNGGMISGGVLGSEPDAGDQDASGGAGGGAGGGKADDDMFGGLKVTKNVWGSGGFTGKAAGMNMSSDVSSSSSSAMGDMNSMGAVGIGGGGANTFSASESAQAVEASIVPG